MKSIIRILILCVVSPILLLSCADEQTFLEQGLTDKLRESLSISDTIDISAETHPTGEPHHYRSVIYLSALGITSEGIPFEIWKEGKERYLLPLNSNEEINEKCQSFLQKVKSAASYGSSSSAISSCDNWARLGDYLSGEALSRYKTLNQDMQDAYGRYQGTGKSESGMNQYNSFIRNTIMPFLEKVGANTGNFDYLYETNEQRARDIEREKEWGREQIKKARNRWVDENPQEARRRGINKF